MGIKISLPEMSHLILEISFTQVNYLVKVLAFLPKGLC